MPTFQLKVRLTDGPLRHGFASLTAFTLLGAVLAGCSDNTARAFAEGQKANTLFQAGDLPGAHAAITRALALRGDQVDLLLLDGRIKFKLGDYGGSFNSYSLVLAIDSMNGEALSAVSQMGTSLGAETEAASAADRILTMEPKNVQAMLVKGLQALNRRDHVGAGAIADRMLAVDPQDETAVAIKARALVLAGEEAKATALLNEQVKRKGPTQMIATALLETARDKGDADLMARQFRTLDGIVPNNVDLTVDEANVQYKRGRTDLARAKGWALIAKHGGDHVAMERLGDLWTEYDPKPLTPEQLAELAGKGPTPARLMAARHYLGAGDTATARQLVGTLLGFEPSGLRVRIGYQAGEAGADGAAEQVLADDKTNCDALTVRGWAALGRHRPNDAVTAAQVVTAECPDRDGYELLARAYDAKGEEAGVRRAFLAGIAARPLSTPAAAGYVDWLMAHRRAGLAADIARSLTQRAPAKVSAWRLLKAVCVRAPALGCVAEASSGEAAARRNFAIDLPPGERRPNPLLGNSWR